MYKLLFYNRYGNAREIATFEDGMTDKEVRKAAFDEITKFCKDAMIAYGGELIIPTLEDGKFIKAKHVATEGDYVILDVRRADEFLQGHIPGAVNIANEDIIDTEPEMLKDKNQTIYVYCRSGNRSKQAAQKLAAMGYTNIIEIGGIKDWTGEIEK